MSDVTARDRVWAAIHGATEFGPSFDVGKVRRQIDRDHRPSDETIRRVLRAATETGVLDHRDGSPYYQLNDRFRDRR